jgi:hypothetical protein
MTGHLEAQTLAGRVRSALATAGYAEYERFRTPRYPHQKPAFLIAEGVGATVSTDWRDAPYGARMTALGEMNAVLAASGLYVDLRDGHLYVYDDGEDGEMPLMLRRARNRAAGAASDAVVCIREGDFRQARELLAEALGHLDAAEKRAEVTS